MSLPSAVRSVTESPSNAGLSLGAEAKKNSISFLIRYLSMIFTADKLKVI